MTESNFLRIKDPNNDGGQLFSGSEILLYVNNYSLSGKNNLQTKERGYQDISLTDDDNSDVGSNYNRRKSNVSFIGIGNPDLTISGFMSESSIGSDTKTIDGTEYLLLNPNRLYKLVLSGRTLYLNDNLLIRFLKDNESTGSNYLFQNGLPIVVDNWSLNPILGDTTEKGINWSLSFKEDKVL